MNNLIKTNLNKFASHGENHKQMWKSHRTQSEINWISANCYNIKNIKCL